MTGSLQNENVIKKLAFTIPASKIICGKLTFSTPLMKALFCVFPPYRDGTVTNPYIRIGVFWQHHPKVFTLENGTYFLSGKVWRQGWYFGRTSYLCDGGPVIRCQSNHILLR